MQEKQQLIQKTHDDDHNQQKLFRKNDIDYYQLIQKSSGKALGINVNENILNQNAKLMQINQQNLQQVWMIQQMKQNKFQIVHAYSNLVLTYFWSGLKLSQGKDSSNQYYYLQKIPIVGNQNKRDYWLKQKKDSNHYLYFKDQLLCAKVQPNEAIWELRNVWYNDTINSHFYLESITSNMVMDVPRSSTVVGTKIILYQCNGRFNQRWILVSLKDCYKIKNFHSNLCLAIKKNKDYEGVRIVQIKQDETAGCQWIFQCIGKDLYLIRSRLNPKICIGSYDNFELQTSTDYKNSIWRIAGNFRVQEIQYV